MLIMSDDTVQLSGNTIVRSEANIRVVPDRLADVQILWVIGSSRARHGIVQPRWSKAGGTKQSYVDNLDF